MDPESAGWSESDRRLLLAHYVFYRALDSGSRLPTTAAQEHFLSVCRGTKPPQTDHEHAYTRFKQIVGATGLDETAVVESGFLLPPAPGDDALTDAVVEVPVRPCASCGRPILPERLEVLPAATQCVACQQRAETAATDWRVSEVECPRCAAQGRKSRLVWRTARDPSKFAGYFLGCSRFPDCRYIDPS
jgi:hypothetical protein